MLNKKKLYDTFTMVSTLNRARPNNQQREIHF